MIFKWTSCKKSKNTFCRLNYCIGLNRNHCFFPFLFLGHLKFTDFVGCAHYAFTTADGADETFPTAYYTKEPLVQEDSNDIATENTAMLNNLLSVDKMLCYIDCEPSAHCTIFLQFTVFLKLFENIYSLISRINN